MSARKLTDEEIVEIRHLAAAGETDIEIAAAYGVALGAVIAIRTGWRRPNAGGPLTKRRRMKTDHYGPRIIKLRDKGCTQIEIAERLAVSIRLVERVLNPTMSGKKLRAELDVLRDRVHVLEDAMKLVLLAAMPSRTSLPPCPPESCASTPPPPPVT